MATALHALTIDAWSPGGGEVAFACLVAAFVVDVFYVEGVDMARDVTVEHYGQLSSMARVAVMKRKPQQRRRGG